MVGRCWRLVSVVLVLVASGCGGGGAAGVQEPAGTSSAGSSGSSSLVAGAVPVPTSCPGSIGIPFTESPDVEGQAAWCNGVTSSFAGDTLHLVWDEPAGSDWAGCGEPTVARWARTLNLSEHQGCSLVFTMRGTGIEQVRVKLRGPDESSDVSDTSAEVQIAGYRDGATGVVRVPLSAFGGPGSTLQNWGQVKQVIWDTWQREAPVDVEIVFPLRIE